MAEPPQPHQRDALITQLCQATGLEPDHAAQYLAENSWNIEDAASHYYSNLEEGSSEEQTTEQASGGPRTLGGDLVPQPIPTTSSAASSSNPRPVQPKKKFATLGDLGGGGQGGNGHDDNDDDDSDDDQDFFAGGEKSGLAVQNPDDLKRKLMEKAKRNAPRPDGDDPEQPSSNFRGAARTLGGDDEPSRLIEDPEANVPKPPERVSRVLHFWSNGFSVDDGPLHDSSDPENAQVLEMIRRGRAPLAIMNVQGNQEVDVRLEPHDGPYVQPKKKYRAFEGSGQRLGSPTPGIASSSGSQPASSVPVVSTPSVSSSTPAALAQADPSLPSVSLQIRLGDGTRLVSRFNTSDSLGNVYDFVRASNPESQARDWVLMTTFPSKELTDKNVKLEDTPELKKGGVVVQKWT